MKASEEWKESLKEMPAAFFLNHTDAVESIDAIDGTDTRSHWRIRLCEILLVFPQQIAARNKKGDSAKNTADVVFFTQLFVPRAPQIALIPKQI